jgi:hypothetical protein
MDRLQTMWRGLCSLESTLWRRPCQVWRLWGCCNQIFGQYDPGHGTRNPKWPADLMSCRSRRCY